MHEDDDPIRVLIADDDEHILRCYQAAFGDSNEANSAQLLDSLEAELFDVEDQVRKAPKFDVVACKQGAEAVEEATKACRKGRPFEVVILDVRMPPGMDGVEAGSEIRKLDPDVRIVFVTGFSDIPRDELERRVPPPSKLHYFNKPLSFLQLAEDVAGMVREDWQ